MELNQNLIKTISLLGNKFFLEHNDTVFDHKISAHPETLIDSWVVSAKLFFKHIFLRGRRDSISMNFYYKFAAAFDKQFGVIDDHLDFQQFIESSQKLDKAEFNKTLELEGLNNQHDRRMIISALIFITQIPDGNVTKYVLENDPVESFHRLDQIHAVGDKLASFYLRNIYRKFKRENEILKNEKNIRYLLPIDTWIGKICFLSGILSLVDNKEIKEGLFIKYQKVIQDYSFMKSKKEKVKLNISQKEKEEIKGAIVKATLNYGINPLDFNQGAWCVGFYSLPLLFSLLEPQNVEKLKFAF